MHVSTQLKSPLLRINHDRFEPALEGCRGSGLRYWQLPLGTVAERSEFPVVVAAVVEAV